MIDLERHKRIAFQYSGGKDSTVALLMMKPFWDQIKVYHGNTGDENPEITRMVDMVRSWGLPVIDVMCDVLEDKKVHGLPSDLIPWSSTVAAHSCNVGFTPPLQDRVSCCFRNLMGPLHQRMIVDGITLIIRGQKSQDTFKGQLRSGDKHDGIEYLYPIEDMSDDEVFDVLAAAEVDIPAYYEEGLIHIGDCLGCTAWNEESRAEYLSRHFPDRFEQYSREMALISNCVGEAANNFLANYFRTQNAD